VDNFTIAGQKLTAELTQAEVEQRVKDRQARRVALQAELTVKGSESPIGKVNVLFTGARRSNVLAMEWSQIEMERMVWRIPVTKNGDSQTIPLTPNCMEILRRRKDDGEAHERWVFPSDRKGRKTGILGHLTSPKTAWARLLERAEIDDLRIHDLRRPAGSYMAIQGVSPTIIGKALGHRSVQATAIYSRLTQDPVRQALENAQAALTMPDRLLSKNGQVEKLAE